MAANYQSVLHSEPVAFMIGPQKKRCWMHKARVATLSKSLYKLLNGPMEEAVTRCVSWEDTDEETFIRFGEWAYTGNYKAQTPEVVLDSSQIGTSAQDTSTVTKKKPITKTPAAIFQNSAQHCGRDWTAASPASPCATCKATFVYSYCATCRCVRFTNCAKCRKMVVAVASSPPLQSMCTAFASNAEFGPLTSATPRHVPRKNTESCEVYTEVFLSHAKLYVLADKYGIPELRKLSLHSLHETLVHFTLYPERIGDIISLVTYSFDNTIEKDKLRSLLVQYCACFAKEISKSKEFEELIYERSDFPLELIKELGRHLN